MALPMVIALTGLWLGYWRRSVLRFRHYLSDRTLATFVALLSVARVGSLLEYDIVHISFPQSPELGPMKIEPRTGERS
jgi:hypothetical protein